MNDDDVTILGATYAPGVLNASWAMGDFDYIGFVDDDDVTLLGVFYEPGAAAANYELPRTKYEIGGEAATPPWPADKEQWPRASSLTLPSRHHGGSSTLGRGIREKSAGDLFGAVARGAGTGAHAWVFTGARKVEQSAVRTGNQPSEDEILVDQVAESIAGETAGRAAGLDKMWLASRRAVNDLIAIWPA